MFKGQYDASNLKGILNNCNVYTGWVDHEESTGWLQSFQNVAKMRNDKIGHNNALRLRLGYDLIVWSKTKMFNFINIGITLIALYQ